MKKIENPANPLDETDLRDGELVPVGKLPLRPVESVVCAYLAPRQRVTYKTGSLIALAGPSGVGKSTWCERLFPQENIFSALKARHLVPGGGDEERVMARKAFYLLYELASDWLRDGQSAVIDCSALSVVERNYLVAVAQGCAVEAHLIVLDGSGELCRQGQMLRGERIIPAGMMEEQLAEMADLRTRIQNKLMGAEGFSSVLSLDRGQATAVAKVII